MIKAGTTNIADIKCGNTDVQEVYSGTSLVWQRPVSISATAVSKQQINLSWLSNVAALRYSVKRSTDAAFSNEKQIWSGNMLSFSDTGLSQNSQYWYRIFYQDVDGIETLIGSKDATTLNAGITRDIDAEAVIEAIKPERTLTTAEMDLINDFFVELKAASIFTKMKTVYVKMWGNKTANRLNWITPIRGQQGHRTTVVGAVTHNARKMSFAGVGGISESVATRAFEVTWLVPANSLSQDDKGYTFNITDAPTDTSTSDDYRFGCSIVSPTNSGDQMVLRGKPNGVSQNDEARISGVNVTGSNFMDTNLPGYYSFQRSGSLSSNVLLRKNGADILTTLNASNGQPTIPFASAGYMTNSPQPNPLSYRTFGINFFAIHESFDGTQMAAWETAYNNLINGLNVL